MALLSGAFSGKLGNAKASLAGGGGSTQVNEVTGWKVEPKIDAPKHASNLTFGMKVPIVGTFEWGGTIDVMPQAGSPFPFQDGDFVDVQLHIDNTGNNYYSGTVLITDAPLDCDINGGKEILISYKFEGATVRCETARSPRSIIPAAAGQSNSDVRVGDGCLAAAAQTADAIPTQKQKYALRREKKP